MQIKIGCCGWSYLNPKEFNIKNYKHTLQAYAKLFSCVEINSTFYRIPKLSTVENWRALVDKINKNFEFTVKCNQLITHTKKFSHESIWIFEKMKEICNALDAKILLLQSPANFLPTKSNIEMMRKFFNKIIRDNLILVWEPRGKWWNKKELIKNICKEFDLINCVDPLRNESQYFGKAKIAYFRLHGFGRPSIYNYAFSDNELKTIKNACKKYKDVKRTYVLFNNANCYEDGLKFEKLIK